MGPIGELFYEETIPDNAHVLYFTTQADGFENVMNKHTPGPGHVNVRYHLVLWEGKMVWVCSEDAELYLEDCQL